MLRFLSRRLILMVIALFIIVSVTWFLMQTLPGTPFQDQKLSDTAREQLYARYGLDDPLPVQYGRYMLNVVQGELGTSFYFDNRPVTEILLSRMPVSAFLGFQALVFGIPVGLVLGAIAALRHNTWTDSFAVLVSILGLALPTFVLGPLLQYLIAFKAGLLPIAFFDTWQHSILPTLTLSGIVIAIVARYIRSEMLEVLGQDYVDLAKSKGLSRATVTFKHVMKNALIPVVTVIPPLAIALITGSIVVENVFAIPGIGEQFVTSITVSDYYMIMGTSIVFAVFFVITLLLQDLLYGLIDPRIRVTAEAEGGES
jgi:oligopeptide transport system permease protein